MRTENDLRIALQHRADESPEPSLGLLERARTAKPRSVARPAMTIGLAVAVVAALIAVPFAVIGHRAHSSNPPTPSISHNQKPTDPLSWVSIDPSLDYARLGQVGTKEEAMEIWLPSKGRFVLLDFAPGSFEADRISHRVPVAVDGHAGYFGKLIVVPWPQAGESAADFAKDRAMSTPQSVLAWPIATDQWVVLYQESLKPPTEATLRVIAPMLKARLRTQPLRLPFKLTYLPPGWSLASTELGNMDAHGPELNAGIGVLNGTHRAVIGWDKEPPDSNLPTVLNRKVGDYWLSLDTTQGPFDTKTAQRILDSAVIATQLTGDNDSWFPISSIVP